MTYKDMPHPKACSGFLNVLKPPGMSSAQVVGRVRRLLGGAKIGHAGTLDPEAAGVLPLMIGKATRLFDYMQDKQKAYVTEIAFGCATDTQDAQGQAVAVGDRYPSREAIEAVLPRFVGEQLQTPPMFSALKRDGHRLYDLARQGQTVALEGRPVTVHSLSLLNITPRHGALLSVACSKGFYVRTLCHDLGEALACPAHMRFLLRTQSGVFDLSTAQTMEQLAIAAQSDRLADTLLPMEVALQHLPALEVPLALEKPLRNGIPLPWSAFEALTALDANLPARLYIRGELIAIGERQNGSLRQRTWLGDA